MGGIQSTVPAQLISTPFPSILTLVFALSPTIPIPPPLPPIFLSHHGQSPLPPAPPSLLVFPLSEPHQLRILEPGVKKKQTKKVLEELSLSGSIFGGKRTEGVSGWV